MRKSSRPSSRKKPTAGGRKRSKNDTSEILSYRDKYIVVDTRSHFIFIGKLRELGDSFITLRDADAHDGSESPSVNEKYIIDAKKYGVRCNRNLVHIRIQEVISVSLLDDVVEY